MEPFNDPIFYAIVLGVFLVTSGVLLMKGVSRTKRSLHLPQDAKVYIILQKDQSGYVTVRQVYVGNRDRAMHDFEGLKQYGKKMNYVMVVRQPVL